VSRPIVVAALEAADAGDLDLVPNREFARAGLPLKSPAVGKSRKLTPAEINEIKARAGIASPQRQAATSARSFVAPPRV
jgi:hypothetical protein